jgi:hypothetical protein
VSVIWQKSPYAIDVLSRHATALQVTKIGQMHSASMNKAFIYQLPNSCHALPPVDWLALTKTQLSATFSVAVKRG